MAPSSKLSSCPKQRIWKGEGREKAERAGVKVLASPHPNPTNRPVRVRTNRQPARTTPKPTGRPWCAPTGNQRAPSSAEATFFQDHPFVDKYAGNKKIIMERVAVTRREGRRLRAWLCRNACSRKGAGQRRERMVHWVCSPFARASITN